MLDKYKITIDQHLYEYKLSGKGKPTIVLLSGYDMLLDSWDKIRPEIEKHCTVFSYNRLDVGYSDNATSNQCGVTIISNLRKLLMKLNIAPPYIIVGHSIGGLYANLYARLYPNEITGLVLIEATHPYHEERLRKFKPPLYIRAINKSLDILETFFSRKKYSELDSLNETASQIKSSGSFPNLPLYVIAGKKKMLFEPEGLLELHLRNQQELAAMSSNGELIIAESSGHFPQDTQPELVSSIIIQLIGMY